MTKSERKGREASHVMAFLQARMGSTRLPGKVLMPIQGKSILERAVERLKAAILVDEVAVLTTTLLQDDAVVEEASRLGVAVYRGSSDDVLRRFQEAAEVFTPDIVVRATADNPLIDIGSVDRIVHSIKLGRWDLCMEDELPYGAATEACTVQALSKAHSLAWEPRDREHVTLYIKEHPELFRVGSLKPPEYLCHPQLRVTVDTPEDLAFMRNLIACIPEKGWPIPLREYIRFTSIEDKAGFPDTILASSNQTECKALPIS